MRLPISQLVHLICNSIAELVEDPVSVRSMLDFWRGYLSQRMSLACYEEKNGQSKLVALNVCLVVCQGEKANDLVRKVKIRGSNAQRDCLKGLLR